MFNNYMGLALEQAKIAFDKCEVPVGAVIVNNMTQEVIAVAYNQVEARQDPTSHAELLAIKKACEVIHNKFLTNCDLYVTLEPCPMCAQAISFARIRRLYFGAYDEKFGGVENGPLIFSSSSCHFRPEIYGGIQENEAISLLKSFFLKLR
jgi:tRNA(Arg) A34 adenosine deaminase TadA